MYMYLYTLLLYLHVISCAFFYISDQLHNLCGAKLNLQEDGVYSGILVFDIANVIEGFEPCTFRLYAGEDPRQLSFHMLCKSKRRRV